MSKFSSPFMAKSPLRDNGRIHVGNPNETPDGKPLGPTTIGSEWMKPHQESIQEAADAMNAGKEGAFDKAYNTTIELAKGGKGRTSTGVPISVPSFTTTLGDAAMEQGLTSDNQ